MSKRSPKSNGGSKTHPVASKSKVIQEQDLPTSPQKQTTESMMNLSQQQHHDVANLQEIDPANELPQQQQTSDINFDNQTSDNLPVFTSCSQVVVVDNADDC